MMREGRKWEIVRLCRPRLARWLKVGSRTAASNPWRGKCWDCGIAVLPKAGIQAIAIHGTCRAYLTLCLKCAGAFVDAQATRAAAE